MENGTGEKDNFGLGARHEPTGLNSRFRSGQPDFSDYIADMRKMLTAAHARIAHGERLQQLVDGNAPFELRPAEGYAAGRDRRYRRGVLLIHGLTDSPYFMRPLAELFQQSGFRVMAILLPGHGTQPGDLLDARWRQWARAVAYGVDRLSEEADEICVAGLSVGAALGILHAQRDARVRSLALFSPALRITERAAYANLHKLHSWLYPAAKWVSIKPDRDWYKYESFPKNAAYQTYAVTQLVQAGLRREPLSIPVFTAASADDVTVESPATLDFFARLPHPHSRLVWYTRDPADCPPGIASHRVELVNSVVPEQNVLSFSHLSLLLPPDDPNYGLRGAYSNCLHYYPDDMEKYVVCERNSPPVLQGEVTDENLQAGVMRRLMYNPHFAALKISLTRFIESLS